MTELQQAQAALEHDRTKVAECVTRIKNELHSYDWLITSRGSYEWNDDKWHAEFKRVSEAIWEAIEPIIKIAADWSNCPTKREDVQAARAPAISRPPTQGSGVEPMKHSDYEGYVHKSMKDIPAISHRADADESKDGQK